MRLMTERIEVMEERIEALERRESQRADPPEFEVVATIRPRYRTRANSAAEGSREPTL